MVALQVIKDEHLTENAAAMGNLLVSELQKIDTPHISAIRGKGLLNAVVIKHSNPNAAMSLCMTMKDNGLLAKPTHGDKIRLAPPLIITSDQVLECVEIIRKSLYVLD